VASRCSDAIDAAHCLTPRAKKASEKKLDRSIRKRWKTVHITDIYLCTIVRPETPRDGGGKGMDTGRRRVPCVAIAIAAIETGADFSTNKNT